MQVDIDRQRQLQGEKAAAEAEIERLSSGKSAAEAIEALRNRIRAIDEELDRMEFAAEVERQSDA
jgi:hypothetical protein